MFRIVGMTLAVLAASATAVSAQSPMERGEYLVNAVLACDGCHTPRGPTGLNMQRRFSGGSQIFDEPAFTVRGSNISQDRETGIGAWSADDLKRLLIEGKRPNGVPVAHQMPVAFYKILTPRDLDAVVTYVRSVPAVRNEVPPPVYKNEHATHITLIPGAEKPFSDADLNDKLKRGFYFATIAHCMECHSRRPDGTQDYVNWQGKGGFTFRGPFGQVPARNISSHREKGIGAWTDAEVRQALTKGFDRSGRSFHLPMARHIYFSKMTEPDLDALVAWVRTIPPIE